MAKIATSIGQAFDLFNLPETEIWKNVNGFEDLYTISSLGRLKSKSRHINRSKSGTVFFKGQLIKLQLHKSGYYMATLNKQGDKPKPYKIHQLVAKNFILNPFDMPYINHKNGIKTDNRVENLEWCTPSYNITHAYKNNLYKNWKGVNGRNSKLTEDDLIRIDKMETSGYTFKQIAPLFPIGEVGVKLALKKYRQRLNSHN